MFKRPWEKIMPNKIAVVGSNMVDLITYYSERMPKLGETIEAPNFEIGCGGKGSNQAVAAAKLGSDVMMITKVGDDLFGDNTFKNYSNNGINTKHVEIVPNTSSGVAPIFVDPSGENSIIIVKGANACLKPSDIDAAAEDLKKCNLIIMQLEVPLDVIYHTIEFGVKNNIETLLNPAPAAKELQLDRINEATFFVPNETELESITNMPVGTIEEITAAAKYLNTQGIRDVIVTMGSKGALLVNQIEVTLIEPCKVDPVDTTGAGDAFIGSFSHYYLQENKDVKKALKIAALYAANSIQKKGTQISYATKEEFSLINNAH